VAFVFSLACAKRVPSASKDLGRRVAWLDCGAAAHRIDSQSEVLSRHERDFQKIAVTHVTQCDACMEYHTTKAKRAGATDEEIVEALFVAMELRAGAALGHHAASARAMENHHRQKEKESAAAPASTRQGCGSTLHVTSEV
jgi:AhpD family alkylhydroperoxidase